MTECVPDCVIVSITAVKYANGGRVSVSTEPVVHDRDVETKFAGMFRLELPRFEFDDDVTQLLNKMTVANVVDHWVIISRGASPLPAVVEVRSRRPARQGC